MSRGLAKRLAKKEKEEKRAYSRKRKRHSFSRTLSDSETDELLESLSFPDQPGEIEGEKSEKTQQKITSCRTLMRNFRVVILSIHVSNMKVEIY